MKKKTSKKRSFILILIIILVLLGVGGFGALFTANPEGSLWYQQVKAQITPPGYIIGIVWNILYVLIGISIYLSLKNKTKDKETSKKLILIWSINLIANALWTYFFFKMQNPILALMDLILIAITCLMLIILNWKIHRTSAYLIIPYLLWLCFAGLLNFLAI